MRKILILDANNAAWRLIKRLPVLTVNGKPIQVVYGFLRLLRSCIEQFEPDVALVCWDSGHSKYRKTIFPQYKGNRDHERNPKHAMEFNSFLSQAELLKTILPDLNVAQAEYPENEADDLIGVACGSIPGLKIVVSSDMDMLQLVSENVQVWSPARTQLYRIETFKKKVGLSPEMYLQMRALVGDDTDNIPGVAKGFGEITATELLNKYGSLDKLFSPEVEKKVSKQGNRHALLYSEGSRKIAFRNLLLMDLSVAAVHCGPAVVDVVQHSIENRKKIDRAKVKETFINLSFKSMLSEFGRWITTFENLDTE